MRVLIAEDEVEIEKALKMLLERNKLSVAAETICLQRADCPGARTSFHISKIFPFFIDKRAKVI